MKHSEDGGGTDGKESKRCNYSRAAKVKQGCPKKPKVSTHCHSSAVPTNSNTSSTKYTLLYNQYLAKLEENPRVVGDPTSFFQS